MDIKENAVNEINKSIIEEYDNNISLYTAVTKKIEHLIVEVLEDQKINYHSVTSRIKKRDSFCKKLEKSEGKYKCLDEVTDVAGVRIITYFDDDVYKVAELLTNEFIIDTENSIDKGALLDPDRFGYLSMHHVVSLTPERCALTEYKRFPDLKIEIQTRSILQHAWAEIEHDLGYKSKQGIPKMIRRDFSRLAGILELADKEFQVIRDDLAKYGEEVSTKIESNPDLVTIDKLSLTSFQNNNELVKELNPIIASYYSAPLVPYEYKEGDTEKLFYFGIETISDIKKSIITNRDKLLGFAKNLAVTSKAASISGGATVFYLEYILLASSKTPEEIETFLNEYKMVLSGSSSKLIAQDIINRYKAL